MMVIINYLLLVFILLVLIGLILTDIYTFVFVMLTKITKADAEDSENEWYTKMYNKIIATIFKLAVETIVLLIGYVLVMTLIRVIEIMMKGGNIVW